MRLSTYICSGAALLMTTGVAQAQHSYLPVINDSTNEIELLGSSGGQPLNFAPTEFGDDFSDLTSPAFRAGSPSPFTQAEMVPFDDDGLPETDPIIIDNVNIPDGFSTLHEGTQTMTMPVLNHPNLDGSGALLYWDGSGDPSFGLAPAFTTLSVSRREATGDGGGLTPNINGTPISATSGAVGPFEIWDIGANGVRVFEHPGHSHLRYDVVGDETAGDNEAPDGFYLFGQITGNVPAGGDAAVDSPLESGIFYILATKGAEEEDFGSLPNGSIDVAEGYVANSVVPEPAAGLMLVIGGALAALTGRRTTKA